LISAHAGDGAAPPKLRRYAVHVDYRKAGRRGLSGKIGGR